MIARIVIPLLLVIVLSDLYIDDHYFRRRYSLPWWLRLLWWVPCIALSTYTITLASLPSFAPSDLAWLTTYLLLLGFFVGQCMKQMKGQGNPKVINQLLAQKLS